MPASPSDLTETAEVVVVGGGVIGCAVAYFLSTQTDFTGPILVIEKDPTYRRCATTLSVGGIRQQFSTPENIEMSKMSARFFKDVGRLLVTDDFTPDLSFREQGYLFLATEQGLPVLQENVAVQRSHDVNLALLSPAELRERFPWLNVADLAGGGLGLRGEGWIDPYSLLMAFKRKAQSQGVQFVVDEVVGLTVRSGRVVSVQLQTGGEVKCANVVNAAGPRAAEIAEMAGIPDLPVRSRKRFVYTFASQINLPDCPLVVDPTGVYFRPEGSKFLCGVSPPAEADPECHDFKVETGLFDEVIWPALAHRVPAFEALERGFSWAGHYDFNVADQNAILGPHPEISNFYFVNGFSGHGLQQSPAAGRAISELILHGTYKTLDLSRFGFSRFATGDLVKERNVV